MTRSHKRLIITFQKGRGRDVSERFPVFERHIRAVLKEMTSTRMINTMRLTIAMRKTKLDRHGDGRAWGTCASHKHSKKSRGTKSKHFPICLHSECTMEQNLNTLTHELMHAVQFAEGRLGWTHLKTHEITYRTWRPVGHTGASIRFPYWDYSEKRNGLGKGRKKVIIPWGQRPWEIEAQQAEKDYKHILTQSLDEWNTGTMIIDREAILRAMANRGEK